MVTGTGGAITLVPMLGNRCRDRLAFLSLVRFTWRFPDEGEVIQPEENTMLRSVILLMLLASPASAGSTCYLYDGDAYWTCLREERADEQALEELREQIKEDTQEALDTLAQE